MDVDEIKAAVLTALEMRPPKWSSEDPPPPREKVERLEDYLLASAWMHAELEEARHWLDLLVEHYKGKVEQIEGWQVALPNGRSGARVTRQDELTAKRKMDPETFELGAEVRQLRETVRRQIERFEFEKEVISRAYTIITGG